MVRAAQQVQEPQVPQEEIEVAEEDLYLLAALVVEALLVVEVSPEAARVAV